MGVVWWGHAPPKETFFRWVLAASPPTPSEKEDSRGPDGPRSPRWGKPLNAYKRFLGRTRTALVRLPIDASGQTAAWKMSFAKLFLPAKTPSIYVRPNLVNVQEAHPSGGPAKKNDNTGYYNV